MKREESCDGPLYMSPRQGNTSPRQGRYSTPHQGNDIPFKLPEALPNNQRILFKRTDYCGGGAQPRPGRKLESRGRTESTDDRFDVQTFSNICTGNRIEIQCGRVKDPVGMHPDAGHPGNGKENPSFAGGNPDITSTDNRFLGSRVDHTPGSRISDFCSRNRPKCPTMTAENEMKAQYIFLEEQYGRICEQESLLRNQMALLQAEIILMQTKAYHKSPANVRRVTIDPIPIRRAKNKARRKVPSVSLMHQMAVKVGDPKVSPGRYFTTKATKAALDSMIPGTKKEAPKTENPPNSPSGENQHPNNGQQFKGSETGDVVNRCFYFDIPPTVVTPPYTKMVPEKVTRHRLPKLPKINSKGGKATKYLVAQMPQCSITHQ